jgi:UDP-N-acetyl-2-amino-2-deoxyglucuronate dehydrogenase
MSALRYALIGCAGVIASTHLRALERLPDARVVAMCDLDAERGAQRAAEVGCPFFLDHRAMLAALHPDVAVICTPHPSHAALALDCLTAGAHVLVEKPLAVEVAEADAMIAAAERAGRIVAVCFQQRFRPAIEHARRVIEEGALGALVRVMSFEPWYRTAAYYASAAWRGTWVGEGGGVLMNQAPHTLDLLCHLVGMPARVWGWTRTLGHTIECEDTAHALLQYPGGVPGYMHVNTVEAGLLPRLQIVGDRAALELAGEDLRLLHFAPSLGEYRRTSPEFFGSPGVEVEVVAVPAGDGGAHLAVHRDLQAAIAEGRRPRCDGREALMSLELANAIILSSFTERPVTLPVDRAAYSALLADLRAGRRTLRPD